MKHFACLAALGLLAFGAPNAFNGARAAQARGQARPLDVGPGQPLRRVLLDALRQRLQADVGQPVQFVVHRLRMQGDWAFYAGDIQTPSGRPIDFRRTRYAERVADGTFDGPSTVALLRRTGGRWRVVAFAVGATDVAEAGWPEEHGVPQALVE